MQGLGIAIKGFEDISALEIKELLGKTATVEERVVIFDATAQDLALLSYRTQSLSFVLGLLGTCTIDTELETTKKNLDVLLNTIHWSEWLNGRTFRAKCKRAGEHDFQSQDLCEHIGERLTTATGAKVALDDPQVSVFLFICGSKGYLGIDFCGFDLSKREYKLFSHATTLNGAVAYGLLRASGFSGKGTLLDPFCGVGVLPIEAGFFCSKKSVRFYQKQELAFHKFLSFDLSSVDKDVEEKGTIIGYDSLLRNVTSAKKNLKIAGIKNAQFSRIDIEWLDTKCDKGTVDFIVTQAPTPSKVSDEKEIEKLYLEFFYQAEFILKKKGVIAMIALKDALLKNCIEAKGFSVLSEREVWQGMQQMKVLLIGRNHGKV